jgi:hypothetical protein
MPGKKIDDIVRLKNETERMRSERDKAKGAFDQVMNRIDTEFGCTTLEAVEKLLRKMQAKNKRTEDRLAEETEKYERELEEHDDC